ncbi:hypothetical protein BDZ45DRAFT_454861 [Acephala macrosclerotiorum]|nr:hypothetical protein BDZ45DRAFT_454861 [Acephala macrosclerotiorum]
MGISTLDTRDLREGKHCRNITKTHHYRTCRTDDDIRFFFGSTIHAAPDEPCHLLTRRLFPTIGDSVPARKVILVGHTVDTEIKIMKSFDIDVTEADSVVQVFDTY